MSDYNGMARTNFVVLEDQEGLKESLRLFNIELIVCEDTIEGQYIGYCVNYNGSFYQSVYVDEYGKEEVIDGEGNEVTELCFSFEQHVIPFIKEGEVLIYQEIGNDDLRYVSAITEAYMRVNGKVQSVGIGLNDIYKLAADTFNVEEGTISIAEYDTPTYATGYYKTAPISRTNNSFITWCKNIYICVINVFLAVKK